ncbi:hypothetical protein B0H10DRAFT_2429321 [Mycena sp. CBHHK59/15]|nr:hypothetical protein B0H10DRAFT_2429321 [Mycena sp. CBHHK59/15]
MLLQRACYPLGAPTSLGLAPCVQLPHSLSGTHPRVHQCITPARALAFTTPETVPAYNTRARTGTLTPRSGPHVGLGHAVGLVVSVICSLPAVVVLGNLGVADKPGRSPTTPTTIHFAHVTSLPCSPTTPTLVSFAKIKTCRPSPGPVNTSV